MATKRKPAPQEEPKKLRGRPPKHPGGRKQLTVYLPPALIDALKRYEADRFAKTGKLIKAGDVLIAALSAHKPFRDFLRKTGLDIYHAVK